jgi:hypothetical protein
LKHLYELNASITEAWPWRDAGWRGAGGVAVAPSVTRRVRSHLRMHGRSGAHLARRIASPSYPSHPQASSTCGGRSFRAPPGARHAPFIQSLPRLAQTTRDQQTHTMATSGSGSAIPVYRLQPACRPLARPSLLHALAPPPPSRLYPRPPPRPGQPTDG